MSASSSLHSLVDRGRWLPWADPGMVGVPRLFCLPHAGGSAALYRPWMRSAQEQGLALCPVELPGRGTWRDASPMQDMNLLVKAMADDLATVFSTERCALFGHSLGALVCAFLADELTRRGIVVAHVYLSAIALDPGWRNRGWSALDDASLCELLALSEMTPTEILSNAEFMSRAMPTIRADLALAEQSRFEAVLDMSVTVMSGARDEVAPPPLVDEWRRVCRGPFRHFEYPDGHHFLRQRLGEILALAADDLVVPPPGRASGTPAEGPRTALSGTDGVDMSR